MSNWSDDEVEEAIKLLVRAADSLQEYCSESGGDMNDSLAMEVYKWLVTPTNGSPL